MLQQIQQWINEDPDPATATQLQALVDANNWDALTDLFSGSLSFGTAGMRGQLGPGPNRMNRAMVRKVTKGLSTELHKTAAAASPEKQSADAAKTSAESVFHEGVENLRTDDMKAATNEAKSNATSTRHVVVGRDMRHGSKAFACDTVQVLAGDDITVYVYPNMVHTPLVSYATRKLNADAGVMVTASHNPPQDNGYKVFWKQGAQIISPIDSNIASNIATQQPLSTITLAPETSPNIVPIGTDMRDAYLAEINALFPPAESYSYERGKNLSIVYTAMHGVAGEIMVEALANCGFTDVYVVEEQFNPNPDFPTVSFPNPEEPGALDLAFNLAKQHGADLLLANDPDGDRIGVAIPTSDGWRALSGDEIGTIIAYDILKNRVAAPHAMLPEGKEPLVATTVVSSQLLGKMAAHFGAHYAETLTGFKWMANAANQRDALNQHMLLSYEQALGVSVGDIVRDKDGISACVYMAELAERLKMQDSSIKGLLDTIATTFGTHITLEDNIALPADGSDMVGEIMRSLRANPPASVNGIPVESIADHERGIVTHQDGTTTPIELQPTALMRFTFTNGSRVMVRPSGTEPKLKFYAEVVEPVTSTPAHSRFVATANVKDLLQTFIVETMAQHDL